MRSLITWTRRTQEAGELEKGARALVWLFLILPSSRQFIVFLVFGILVLDPVPRPCTLSSSPQKHRVSMFQHSRPFSCCAALESGVDGSVCGLQPAPTYNLSSLSRAPGSTSQGNLCHSSSLDEDGISSWHIRFGRTCRKLAGRETVWWLSLPANHVAMPCQ